MVTKKMHADRIGGLISIVCGSIAISEAIRLYPSRMSPLVGDHTMPGFIGAGMILCGLLLLFVIKGEGFKIEYPSGKIIGRLLATLALLIVYWILIQYLGYTISTLFISIGLFKVIGSYSFFKSTLFAVLLTTCLYMLFIYWLGMPFPIGFLTI